MTLLATSITENVNDGLVPPIVQVSCMYGARTGIDLVTLPVVVTCAKASVEPSLLPKLVPSSDHWIDSVMVGDVPEAAVTSSSSSRFAAPEPTAIAPELPVAVRAAEATKVFAAIAASFGSVRTNEKDQPLAGPFGVDLVSSALRTAQCVRTWALQKLRSRCERVSRGSGRQRAECGNHRGTDLVRGCRGHRGCRALGEFRVHGRCSTVCRVALCGRL